MACSSLNFKVHLTRVLVNEFHTRDGCDGDTVDNLLALEDTLSGTLHRCINFCNNILRTSHCFVRPAAERHNTFVISHF